MCQITLKSLEMARRWPSPTRPELQKIQREFGCFAGFDGADRRYVEKGLRQVKDIDSFRALGSLLELIAESMDIAKSCNRPYDRGRMEQTLVSFIFPDVSLTMGESCVVTVSEVILNHFSAGFAIILSRLAEIEEPEPANEERVLV